LKDFSVNWYQRISLWSRIGSIPAPTLKEASVFLRILDKVRPTDEESKVAKLTATNNGYAWSQLPSIEYGSRQVELEDEEAKSLADALDTHPQPVLVADAAWMLLLLERLRAEPPAAVPKKKKEHAA
jgi:hypothetical protein